MGNKTEFEKGVWFVAGEVRSANYGNELISAQQVLYMHVAQLRPSNMLQLCCMLSRLDWSCLQAQHSCPRLLQTVSHRCSACMPEHCTNCSQPHCSNCCVTATIACSRCSKCYTSTLQQPLHIYTYTACCHNLCHIKLREVLQKPSTRVAGVL